MYKTHARKKNLHHSDYDLYGDIEKIKAALSEANEDVKGRASELFTQSMEDARNKSAAMEENISDYVAEHTFKSLGLALLAGALVGYILRK